MIAETETVPLCRHCKHSRFVVEYDCNRAQDVVAGWSAKCAEVRKNQDLCGREGAWFERRQNIETYVNAAPITTYVLKDDGSVHEKPTAIETPMATIRKADDPDILKKLRPDDYRPE